MVTSLSASLTTLVQLDTRTSCYTAAMIPDVEPLLVPVVGVELAKAPIVVILS